MRGCPVLAVLLVVAGSLAPPGLLAKTKKLTRSRSPNGGCARVRARKIIDSRDSYIIPVIALFRTCLWPCVDRWASGQEAGQPPEEEASTSLAP